MSNNLGSEQSWYEARHALHVMIDRIERFLMRATSLADGPALAVLIAQFKETAAEFEKMNAMSDQELTADPRALAAALAVNRCPVDVGVAPAISRRPEDAGVAPAISRCGVPRAISPRSGTDGGTGDCGTGGCGTGVPPVASAGALGGGRATT